MQANNDRKRQLGENMNRIIIFKSNTDSLRMFAELVAKGFEENDYQVMLADVSEQRDIRPEIEKFSEPGQTRALFFNHAGLNILTDEHESIWNVLDVDCYNLIVDHPMYYHVALIFPIKKLTFLCVDEYHQKFINRFYKGKVRSYFLPLAGIGPLKPIIPLEERSIDVLFTGAYLIDDNIEYHIADLGDGLRKIWLECFEWLLIHKSWTLEQTVEMKLKSYSISVSDEELRDTVRLFQDMDGMLRSRMRAEVIKTLANHDVHVHVYGEGWEFLECKQENLTINARIPFDKTIPLIADAKIVLNVMPWFKAGVHDRVYSAMLNHSVSLTDSSEYLEKTVKDGENILIYSLDDLKKLPMKIKWYLSHPKEMERVAENGFKYAINTQTWQNRAKQLMEIMEG